MIWCATISNFHVRFLQIRSGHGQGLSEASFAGMSANQRFVKNVHEELRVAHHII